MRSWGGGACFKLTPRSSSCGASKSLIPSLHTYICGDSPKLGVHVHLGLPIMRIKVSGGLSILGSQYLGKLPNYYLLTHMSETQRAALPREEDPFPPDNLTGSCKE